MSFVYTVATEEFQAGLDLVNDDIRFLLVMSNSTADTEEDVQVLSGFTTLDEYDGTNYARKVLAGKSITQDTSNNKSVFDADAISFTSLGAGTRECIGAIFYKHVTDDTDSIPLFFLNDVAQFPFQGMGETINFDWGALGIHELLRAA